MPYQEVPINVVGPSYVSRSLRLSAQQTVNWYQEINPGAKTPNAHLPFPGLKLFGKSAGQDRGATVMDETLYQVKGTTLYRISKSGDHTALGSIPGSARCIFANDGKNLFIVTGATVYHWNGSSVSTVADPAIQGSTAVTYQNRQFIYTKDPEFIVSDVGNGASASALNVAQAESQPDSLVRAYVFKDDVMMFGTETTEPWYNTGIGSPPFDRITGQSVKVGLQAIHSVANNDNYTYFLADDDLVYQAISGVFNPISSIAVAHAIQNYPRRDDAIGWCFTTEGQNFYCITFPEAGKTWLLNESLGPDGWTELSSGLDGDVYRCTSGVRCYGKNLFFDAANGSVYELDASTFTESGSPVKRVRTLPPLHGGLLGVPGRRLQMSSLLLEVETGIGLLTGQGENPRLMVEFSIDGGMSFTPGGWPRVGRLGERTLLVQVDKMLSFHELVIRISCSDPVFFTLHGATITLRPAGRW